MISQKQITATDILRVLSGDVGYLRELESYSTFEIIRISEQLPPKARTLTLDAVKRVVQDLLNNKIGRLPARAWAAFMRSNDAIEYAPDQEAVITEALSHLEQKGDALYDPLNSSVFLSLLERLSK